jgi:hypothetical protein
MLAMQRLSEPGSPVRALFKADPFAGEPPPRWFRATLYALVPTTPGERRRTGRWWTRRRVGTHLAPFEASAHIASAWLNGPELFHWDNVVWRRRAAGLAAFEDAAAREISLDEIERRATALLGQPAELVEQFWQELIPGVQPTCRRDWRDLERIVQEARLRFGRPQLLELERLASVLALALAARIEARIERGSGEPLPLPSYFHLGLLAYGAILDGRAAYSRTLEDPGEATRRAASLDPVACAWLWALFRPETMLRHARSFNLVLRLGGIEWHPIVPGFVLLAQDLAEQDSDELSSMAFSQSVENGDWLVDFPERAATSTAPAAGRTPVR